MANTTLSQLASIEGTAVAPTDSFLIYDISANAEKKITLSALRTAIGNVGSDSITIASTSESAALRITQTGTGNALVVEDDTNPDSTPFVITANGNVGIGLTPSTSDPLTGVAAGALQVNGNIELRYAGANTDPGGARYFNIVNTDTTLVADQPLGGIQWIGLDTDNPNSNMASITSYCANNAGTTGDLRFKIAGVENMRIAANGNVGIGTTTPNDLLHINGTNGELFRISITSNSSVQQTFGLGFATGSTNIHPAAAIYTEEFDASDSRAALTFSTRGTNDDTAPTERMRIDSSGNVLVGNTASRGARFEVERTDNDNAIVDFKTNNASGDVIIRSSGGLVRVRATGTNDMALLTSGTERMLIAANSNVGIGTSSPEATLDIVSTGLLLRLASNTTSGYALAHFGRSATATQNWHIGSEGDGTFRFYNGIFGAGSERMRINSAGNVGIGTNTTTNAALNVSPTTAAYTGYFSGTSDGQNLACRATVDGNAIRFLNTSGTDVGRISSNTSATAYATSSDYRLKENVQPMQDALVKISQLNPVTYTWKSNGSDGQGFIAHELQAVVPDCVLGEKDAVDADGNPQYQGVDTSFLVATLVKAVQELTDRITALETEK